MRLKGEKAYANTWIIRDDVWELKFKKSLGDLGDGGNAGLCDPSIKVCYIARGQANGEIFMTMLHEFIHAMEFEYDIKIPHPAIYKLEVALSRFFLDNLTALSNILDIKKR